MLTVETLVSRYIRTATDFSTLSVVSSDDDDLQAIASAAGTKLKIE